jgi:hypothetical protein
MATNDKDTGKELLFYLLDSVDRLETIQPDEIPNIDLYMDQVTTFMEEHLKNSCRHSDDKILTKTMINNYAKNNLMPPPEKKKYTREHIMLLIFIYYYKGFLSLQDIQSILQPLGEKYFHADQGKNVEDIYSEITRMNGDRMENFREEVNDMEDTAADYFQDAEPSEKEFLRVFSMINMLAYDVYVRRMLIEKLIDRYFRDEDPGQGKNQRRRKKAGSTPDPDR